VHRLIARGVSPEPELSGTEVATRTTEVTSTKAEEKREFGIQNPGDPKNCGMSGKSAVSVARPVGVGGASVGGGVFGGRYSDTDRNGPVGGKEARAEARAVQRCWGRRRSTSWVHRLQDKRRRSPPEVRAGTPLIPNQSQSSIEAKYIPRRGHRNLMYSASVCSKCIRHRRFGR